MTDSSTFQSFPNALVFCLAPIAYAYAESVVVTGALIALSKNAESVKYLKNTVFWNVTTCCLVEM
jgi:uncharacterized membrane protein